MPPFLTPRTDPHLLLARLGRLRRRLRVVETLRGLGYLVALVLGAAVLLGVWDRFVHLPGLVRAVGLVGTLSAAGVLVASRLVAPLKRSASNFRLALRLEQRYPQLADLLATAVQFLERPGDPDTSGSPVLRKATVTRAVQEARGCDFSTVLNVRGLWRSGLAAALALAAAVPLITLYPEQSRVALTRLLDPFGETQWPPRTRLTVTSPDRSPVRLARLEPVEIKAEFAGELPDRATFSVWFEGSPPADTTWNVEHGKLAARIEANRVVQSFRYRVRAGDADSGWREAVVLPPPVLAPLDGRPSPQIHLTYPPYTGLSPKALPDGTGVIECVAGTRVRLRAATDRPVANVYLVHRPDPPALPTAARFAPLASASDLQTVGAFAAAGAAADPVPATLAPDGRSFEIDFAPRLPGPYALRFEDDTGLGGTRLLDVKVFPDPAPAVTLERPSPTLDSLNVTPQAVLRAFGRAEDPTYAVRGVWLEFRTNRDSAPRRVVYYDHTTLGEALPRLLPLGAALASHPRPPAVAIDQPLKVASFTHPDGSPLREGDVLTVQLAADDFDDVTGDKAPGRSGEVELRIVSPSTLDALLQKDQAAVRQEILKLRQQQRDALQLAREALRQQQATGKLRPEDHERLIQAEQIQQQIRSRIGDDKEGLRAEAERVQRARRDNQLPPSASQDRMQAVTSELDRLGREELPAIEPQLAASRREAEEGGPMKTADPKAKAPLGEAVRKQDEVERTLTELLERLEPWSGANEVRGEARMMLEEQKRLNDDTEKLRQTMPTGEGRPRLNDEQRADLDRAADRQQAVANQLGQLLDKMDRLAEDRKQQARERLELAKKAEAEADDKERQADSPNTKGTEREAELRRQAEAKREEAEDAKETAARLQKEAEALKQAAQKGRDELKRERLEEGTDKQTNLDDAASDIRQNRLGNARQQQAKATQTMERMLESLEERRQDDLDRMAKKMRDIEGKLDDLADRQERLRKKVKDAEKIADREKREEELARLAREQQQLQQEAHDLAQQLARMRSGSSSSAMNRAAKAMEDAAARLERGEKPDESQEESLQRLEDAVRDLEQSREQLEDELMREKLAKVADRLKGVRDRQESAVKESKRVHEAATRKKEWPAELLSSLGDQIDVENALAGEVEGLVEKRFKPAKVFARMLEQTSEAMKAAGKRIQERFDDAKNRPVFDPEEEQAAQAETLKWQELALRRLDQLLESIKPDKEMAKSSQQQPGGGGNKPGGGAGPMGGGGGGESDDLPPLAQLKALRALQADVQRQTAEFAKVHPDVTKLTEPEAAELEAIRKAQRDVAELIQDLTVQAEQKEKGERP